MKLVLKLKKIQEDKNSQRKFGDYDLYDLVDASEGVDETQIANYRIHYFRRMPGQETYYMAEIEYYNYHIKDENNPYVRKGLTTKGLIKIKEMLLQQGIPYIYLSINEDNIASKGVSKKAGFINDVVFRPDALEILKNLLADLPDEEMKDRDFARFKQMYDKYMDEKRKLDEQDKSIEH